MLVESKPTIGEGIYTVPDLSRILKLKYYKVQRVLNEYWDKRLAPDFGGLYSWTDGNSRAVNFHTLVEFYTFFQLRESGINTKVILRAHQELAEMYNTTYPFANSRILGGIGTFGKKIKFQINDDTIIDMDMTKQLNLKFIKDFMNKLDFENGDLANKLWPLGKERSIVVDPEHQFGQPTINRTNIIPQTIFLMAEANEPIPFIAATFDISKKQVMDAITFCKQAA